MKYLIVFILFLAPLLGAGQQLSCADCDIVIDGNSTYTQDGNNYTYSPGDTIGISSRGSVFMKNWHGTKQNPLTIINCDGQAIIDGGTDNFVIENMSHFRLTGTGDPNVEYGFLLQNSSLTGLSIRRGYTTDFEVDHIETANSGGLGVFMTTPFDCNHPEGWKENHNYRNISIHDNYFHDSGDENVYLGQSNNTTITCNNDVKEPNKIRNIEYYNNIHHTSGRDNFQIGQGDSAVYIYNNIGWDYGRDNIGVHDDGFVSNNNTTGDWYNNIIINTNPAEGGDGSSISVLGFDGKFYNNVLIGAEDAGIFVGNRSPDSLLWGKPFSYQIYNNTIIALDAANGAINHFSEQSEDSIVNNILQHNTGDYINQGGNATKLTNLTDTDSAVFDFVDPHRNDTSANYHLKNTSPAIDQATDLLHFDFDADSLDRNSVTPWDIGAYEFGATAFSGGGGGGDETNSAPNLSAIDDQGLTEGDVTNVEIESIDINGDPITLSGSNLPSFATLTDDGDGTGSLGLSPTAGDAGTYLDVTITATDNEGASDSESFYIEVSESGGGILIPEEYLR